MDAALKDVPAAVILCDRTLGGLPIVSCSAGMQRLTGYLAHEMIGWNCRMLQGPESEQPVIEKMIAAIRQGNAVEVSITNYRKDGRPFTNQVSLGKTLRIHTGSRGEISSIHTCLVSSTPGAGSKRGQWDKRLQSTLCSSCIRQSPAMRDPSAMGGRSVTLKSRPVSSEMIAGG